MPQFEGTGSSDSTEVDEPEPATGLRLGVSRRGFGIGLVGATFGAGLLSGCRQCFSPTPPRHEEKRARGARTFTIRANVQPSRYRALVDLLDDPGFNPFQTPGEGIHFGRLFTADHRYLYLMVIYDDYEDAIEFLHINASGVDRVFEHCSSYPGATNKARLAAFVKSTLLCVELFYRAYDESQPEIRYALAMRDTFLAFMRSTEGLPEAELRKRYATLISTNPILADQGANEQVDWADTEAGEPQLLTPLVQQGPMEGPPAKPIPRGFNDPDRVSPFTLMAQINPGKLLKLSRRLRLGTYAVIDLGLRPLKNLPTLHFARVSIIDGNRMLFASVYDGDFLQYVEDFGTRIADQIDKVFGLCVGYPLAGSRDVFAFRDFLRANELVTRDFAGSNLDRSLLQIRSSLELTRALAHFSKRVGPEHRNLPARLQRFLHKNQGLLT